MCSRPAAVLVSGLEAAAAGVNHAGSGEPRQSMYAGIACSQGHVGKCAWIVGMGVAPAAAASGAGHAGSCELHESFALVFFLGMPGWFTLPMLLPPVLLSQRAGQRVCRRRQPGQCTAGHHPPDGSSAVEGLLA